jgi:tetratricopeptide (TPR) repeat protein
MRASRQVTIYATCLLLCSMAGSALLLYYLDKSRPVATLQETLFISSPKVLKRMSLGYEGLLADIYWTRAVQYFGNHHAAGAEHYDLLPPLLNITTTLDPNLLPAYEFGASFLATARPNGAGMPEQAVELMQNGIRNNPGEWRLYFNLGFIYYLDLKDPEKAALAFLKGSQLPNAHPWLKILAARMAGDAGDTVTAEMMWRLTYDSATDKQVKANAAAHLRALAVDAQVSKLESMVARYQLATGVTPRTFGDLARAGMLSGIPIDPLGNPYVLTADGRVVVSDPDKLPFIKFGLPLGYKPPAAPKLPAE